MSRAYPSSFRADSSSGTFEATTTSARQKLVKGSYNYSMNVNRETYSELIKTLPDIVYRIDSNGNFIYVNDSIQKLGYDSENLIGKHFSTILHPEDAENVQRAKVLPRYRGKQTTESETPRLFDEKRTGERITRNLKVRLKNARGSSKHYDEGEVIAIGLYKYDNDTQKNFLGTIGLIRDLSEINRARRALLLTERHYRLLIENVSEVISIVAHDGTILFVSESITRILGFDPINVIGENITSFIHPSDKNILLSIIDEPQKYHATPQSVEFRFESGEGPWRYLESSIKRIEDERNATICFILNSRDITERRKVEALRESAEKYHNIIENTYDIIYTIDMERKFIQVNEAFQRETGYRSDQVIGKSFETLIHPDDTPATLAAFERNQRGEPFEFETRARKKDGNYGWYHLINYPIIGANGEVICIHGIARNITPRKRAEEALKESEEKFANAFHSSPIAMAINTLREGKFIDINESTLMRTGYLRDEIIGTTIAELSLFAEKKSYSRFLKVLKRDRKVNDFECAFRLKSGELRSGIISAEIVKIKGENCIISSTLDITKWKTAEKALLESEERYKQLVENATDIIYWTNDKGQLTFVNPMGTRILGFTLNEFTGKHYLDFIHPDYRKDVERHYNTQFAKKVPNTYYEFLTYTKDGRELWLGQNVQLIIEENRVAGFQAVGRDITERKHADEKIRTTMIKLRKAMNGIIQAIELTVEARDLYTAGHQRRVSDLARAIADEMNLPKNTIEGIRIAGLLHDIGKVHVPAEILSKPGQISDVEFSIIQSHPRVGYEILKNIEFPWPVDEIVHQHHERIDGSGYPHGLSGDEILIEAKILAVADVVEAMSSHRPYRASPGIDSALEEIEKNRNILYDPEAVDACLRLFREKNFKFDKRANNNKIELNGQDDLPDEEV